MYLGVTCIIYDRVHFRINVLKIVLMIFAMGPDKAEPPLPTYFADGHRGWRTRISAQ